LKIIALSGDLSVLTSCHGIYDAVSGVLVALLFCDFAGFAGLSGRVAMLLSALFTEEVSDGFRDGLRYSENIIYGGKRIVSNQSLYQPKRGST
jgi:hypothetical protein